MDQLTAAMADCLDVSKAVRVCVIDGTLSVADGYTMLLDAIDNTVAPALASLS